MRGHTEPRDLDHTVQLARGLAEKFDFVRWTYGRSVSDELATVPSRILPNPDISETVRVAPFRQFHLFAMFPSDPSSIPANVSRHPAVSTAPGDLVLPHGISLQLLQSG